ncbi:MAG: methyltransferase [Bacteroidota bacterium]
MSKATGNSSVYRLVSLLLFSINLILYLAPAVYAIISFLTELKLSLPTSWTFVLGVLLALLGRFITLRGAVVLRSRLATVVKQDIFKWSRNPIALGMHCTLLGLILCTEQWYLLLGLVFTIWNINKKIKIEEQYLIDRFGAPYVDYMQQTPRYLWMY